MLQPLLLKGEWVLSSDIRPLLAPYGGAQLAEVAYAESRHIEAVLESLPRAQRAAASLPTYRRYEILDRLTRWLESQAEAMAQLIAQEAAKPLRYARAEVRRGLVTLSVGRDLVRLTAGEI
ncbi:MAG: aldehyde dehydrogenase family protein, partial [Bacteroidetes bacterium]